MISFSCLHYNYEKTSPGKLNFSTPCGELWVNNQPDAQLRYIIRLLL